MKKTLEDGLSMWIVLRALCNNNNAIWFVDIPFSTTFGILEIKIDAFLAIRIVQETNYKGYTIEKNAKREALEEIGFFVMNRIQIYAKATNDNVVLEMINFTLAKLKKQRDTTVYSTCILAHQKATTLLVQLANYGITQPILDDLQDKLDDYLEYLPKPGESRSIKSESTNNLDIMYREIMDLLKNRLDTDVQVFALTHPDFYGHYFEARKISDSPTTTMALKVTVVDQETKLPIAMVNAHIPDAGIDRLTGPSGVFEVLHLSEGSHDILLDNPLYHPLVYTVIIVNGETTEVIIEMMHV